ncbi:MAG: FHA domain-containing protein [Leptolyngbyaceae cyanobacterium MO_188.B28]|nr:FHA domain-containing protein [Leptolyngbyaceae cyanobacterium MO_188.B28]
MSAQSLFLQLSWQDPETDEFQQRQLAPPVAIGRDVGQMPDQLDGQPVAHLDLADRQISRFHALITVINQRLYVIDQSANGTFLNGQPIRQKRQAFSSRDTLRIGSYKITVAMQQEQDLNATEITGRTERSNYQGRAVQNMESADQNTMAIWLIGIVMLLVIGLGTWFGVRTLLERARPQAPETSSTTPSEIGQLQ